MSIHKRSRLSVWLFAAGLLLMASACSRTLPSIEPELLKEKKSVLLVTASSIPEDQTRKILASALETARKEQIALESVANMSTLTGDLSSKIKSNSYDAVIAAGEELIADMLPLAQEQTGKRFILLQGGTKPAPEPGAIPSNVSIKRLDDQAAFTLWDEWVRLQRAAGMNIVWVTRTTLPVPSGWAPSEEADAVLPLDVYGEQWFQQLSFQTKNLQAQWIALYTSMDPNQLNKIKSLHIPIMDIQAATVTTYNWNAILPQELVSVKSKDWHGGVTSYTTEQVSVVRK